MLCKITNVLTGEECIRDATLMLRREAGKTGTARALLPPGDDQAYFDEPGARARHGALCSPVTVSLTPIVGEEEPETTKAKDDKIRIVKIVGGGQEKAKCSDRLIATVRRNNGAPTYAIRGATVWLLDNDMCRDTYPDAPKTLVTLELP